MEYTILIAENIRDNLFQDYATPTSTYEDAIYWAKRTIELGSKEVTVWKGPNLIKTLKENKQ